EYRLSVLGAVLFEGRAIGQPGNDFTHVVLPGRIGGEDAVNIFPRIERRLGRLMTESGARPGTQFVQQNTYARKTGVVVRLAKIDGSAHLGVYSRASQVLRGDFLADGRLHQRRPGQKQAAALRHQDVIAHHRQVSAARHAHSHDGCDLRDSHGAHDRIVAEDAAEVVGIREDVLLQRQKNARGVHKINRGDAVLHGDILRAYDLLGRHGKEGAGFYRGVVGDQHDQSAAYATEAGDDPCRRRATPFLVHLVCGVEAKLEERAAAVKELVQALPRRQPALVVLRRGGFAPAALANSFLF